MSIVIIGHSTTLFESNMQQPNFEHAFWRPAHLIKKLHIEPAYLGAQRLLQEKEELNLQDMAQEVQEFLTRKYDLGSWSVRVVNHSGSSWCARDCAAGERYQPGGFLQHQSPTDAPRLHPSTDGGAGDEGRCPGRSGGPGEAAGRVRGSSCQSP